MIEEVRDMGQLLLYSAIVAAIGLALAGMAYLFDERR